LGAFPSENNAETLLSVLRDLDHSVRYGAVRSLIELASRASDELRLRIFRALIEDRAQLVEFSSVRDEIGRSVLIWEVRNPRGWSDLCLKLMIAVQPTAQSDRDKWNRTIQVMIDTFAETERPSNA
jgi:hypothetical protein